MFAILIKTFALHNVTIFFNSSNLNRIIELEWLALNFLHLQRKKSQIAGEVAVINLFGARTSPSLFISFNVKWLIVYPITS